MAEDCTDILLRLRETTAYADYARALRVADIAGPKDIPKADGLLKHAELVLRQSMLALQVKPEDVARLVAMCKAEARSA